MKSIQAKTGISMKAMIIAVALTALAMGKAHGAELKASGAVTGTSITVGDIFDGAGEHASRYLAPLPARGEALALHANDLKRIATAFALQWEPSAGRDYIVLKRESNDIDRYAIEAALQEQMLKQLNGQRFDLELPADALMELPRGTEKTVQATNVRVDLQRNTFTATLSAPANAAVPAVRKTISGSLYTLTQVPVLGNAMRQGDVISAADIEYVDMRAADLSAGVIVKPESLIGQTPRRSIAAMRPIAASDIQPPMLVKKGDLVTVALQNGALGLTLQGRAMQNGSEGDIVRIVNTGSNRTIEGIVTGAQTVALRLPSSAL